MGLTVYAEDNAGKEVARYRGGPLGEDLAINDDIRAALGISDDEWENSPQPRGEPVSAAKLKRLVARIDKDIKAGTGGEAYEHFSELIHECLANMTDPIGGTMCVGIW
jgi:hypothetical protein